MSRTDNRMWALVFGLLAGAFVLLFLANATWEASRALAGKGIDPDFIEMWTCAAALGVPGAASLSWLIQALSVMGGSRLPRRRPDTEATDCDDKPHRLLSE